MRLFFVGFVAMTELNHFDSNGNARMVDVGNKPVSRRTARAVGVINMRNETARLIETGSVKKGDVLNVARVAGISGSKWTPHLIPMCHPIHVDSVEIEFSWNNNSEEYAELNLAAVVQSTGRTGVEMEALSAVTIAALAVYDMCKSADREMSINRIYLAEKTGGKSGHFINQHETAEE